jgi:hypothetical protein
MSEITPDNADAAAYQGDEPASERRPCGTDLGELSDHELAQLVELAIADDRAFFARHRYRAFRVRRALPAEVEQFARHRAWDLEPPPQVRRKVLWWICVHRVHEKLRVRIPFVARRLPPGASARAIWETAASPRTKAIVAAARERGTS